MFSKRLVGLVVIACLLFCFSAAQADEIELGSRIISSTGSAYDCESFTPWVALEPEDGSPEAILFENLSLTIDDEGATFWIRSNADDPDFSIMALALANGIDNWIAMGKPDSFANNYESRWFGTNPDFKGNQITAFSLTLESIEFEPVNEPNVAFPCYLSYRYVLRVYGIPQSAAIPTLSEWGMIILALLMAGTAIVFVKKREMAA